MKKRIKIALVFVIIIILGGLVLLSFLGKPIKVHTDMKLEGVDENICNALYYASLAANSHNAQSWKVELNTNKQLITISIDEERTLNVVDPNYRELYISLGCYIESMIYSFDAHGYDTIVEYANAGTNIVANISYSPRDNSEIDRKQIEVIKLRHTDKSAYKADILGTDVVKNLLENSVGIYYYEIGSKEFDYLKKGTLEAIKEQSFQSAYREELNLWMRFSDKEVLQNKDGICAEMIGLKGFIKAFYYLTTNHDNAEKDTFAKQGIDTAKKQVENCAAFFVITGDDTIVDWIEAGRKTQSFWYKCVENGVAVQPLSAMLEVEPYSQEIQGNLGTMQNVQMILRVGYVEDYGENVGVRRNLNEYITVIQHD